ncbi:brassinin detoxification factor 1 [Curvularia clavata]|uniref:Brassinin detoxification factor 1 n=1 Tax=Curvularia clavata TaxID=95742 RepID=A0A9Q8ZEA8_CURCL|nr:brassinin detoxification factor 1 [Curvularia clavata]
MPKEETLPTRKKMRKVSFQFSNGNPGRRRKIRCIFQPDNPDVCSECFARGNRCIDQEHANPDIIVDHRKNLRERVSRLESLVDALLEDKTVKSESRSQSIADTSSPKALNNYTKDGFPPTPLSSESPTNTFKSTSNRQAASERGHHVPILSVFEDALNDAEAQAKVLNNSLQQSSTPKPNQAEDERYTVENRNDEDIAGGISSANSAKREKAKQALIAVLPPYEQLTKILHSNSGWWEMWRRKCSGTSGPDQTLAQFAAQALTTGNVGAIAMVVLSVGICESENTDQVQRYFETVDRWFLFDDEYAASLEGLECLVLKSKWYADIGQPRRAWIAYRKGLMYAQLIGLHRKRTSSVSHESLWWALYHGDRFLSLMLGLPYGINDSHCDLTLPETGDDRYIHPMVAMTKLSQVAGRVIDRNQGMAEQSFAWALQLDQEIEDLWKRLDPVWIDYRELLADANSNAAELRERIMGQMVFHQVRVYLHLPFMLKSASNSRFSYSRTATLNGSREVMRLYHTLRTGSGTPLYECKAIDFIGFTAAVLIQIGLLSGMQGHSSGSSSNPDDVEEDVRLIETSIEIFRRASSEKGGNVAAQSAEVLERMMGKFKGTHNELDEACHGASNFVIPYFGTISVKRGGQLVKPPARTPSTVSSRSPGTSHQTYTPTSERQSSTSDVFSQPTKSVNVTPKTSISTATGGSSSSGYGFGGPSPFVSYDGFYNWNNLNADDASTAGSASVAGFGPQINGDDGSAMGGFTLPTNNFSWQNMPMDIDQDWSWFLNDAQTTQSVAAGAPGPALPLDVFNTQGFTGFG